MTNEELPIERPTAAVSFFRWLMLNIVMPLIPLFFVWFLLKLNNKTMDWAKSTDLLFFSVVLTLSAIGDITTSIRTLQTDLFWNFMLYGMIIGLVVSAGFYGLLVYNLNLPSPDAQALESFRNNLFPYTVGMTALFIVASTATKYFVARVECRL